MKLTKAVLIEAVYRKHENLTQRQATEAVESLLRLAKDALIDGNKLLLSGFGKFSIQDKKPRRGRNPQTGDDLILESRRIVTFKSSGKLRKIVNG
ncbi:integration host factor subunit alpha [Desulfopila sp. IMCC35008]|uniref:integration host factor subunit alpha n=1 Tax=Desulfopila sp. IMCC35008 TaxID=2653858 RepID=UPI0013D44D05|nr:integration host factor subunit alpha [Desulfopila sp. IMCC35008]